MRNSPASQNIEVDQRALRTFHFKAFLSYSHAADGNLAPALQSALHRIARPWYRLRSMWIFRDKTGLSVTPSLWEKIEAALAESEYFLLMASPEAAASKWVQQEVDWWLAKWGTKNLLVLLTDGQAHWDAVAKDWDWSTTTALPPNLRGHMTQEPLWVDFRWAKSEDGLSLRHSQFRGAILDIAATLLGTAKELLDSEDIRVYRRNRSVAYAALIVSLLLAATAIAAAFIANRERLVARHEASRADTEANSARLNADQAHRNQLAAEERERVARSRALAIQARESRAHPDTSLLLGIAAIQAEPTLDAESSLLGTLLVYPRLESSLYAWHAAGNRLVQTLASAPDGRALVVGYQDGAIIVWNDTDIAGMYLRRPQRGWLSDVSSLVFSPDGRYLAAAISNGSIQCWDWKARRPLPPIWLVPQEARRQGNVPDSRAEALAFNPKTGLLAAGQFDGHIRLWNVANGQAVGPEFGDPIPPDQNHHSIGVQSLAFTSDGSLLASGHGGRVENRQADSVIRIWDANQNYQAGKIIRTGTSGVRGLAVRPHQNWIAYGGSSTAVELVDMLGPDRRTFELHDPAPGIGREGATSLAFDSDGDRLFAGFADGRVALWHDIDSVDEEALIPDIFASGHSPFVAASVFVPQKDLFVTGGPDGVVRKWQARREPVGQPFGELSNLRCVFSSNSSVLTCIGTNSTLEWWDVNRRLRLSEYQIEAKSIISMSFINEGQVELVMRERRLFRCTRRSCIPILRGNGDNAPPRFGGQHVGLWFEWRDRPYRCTTSGCERLPGPRRRYTNVINTFSADGLRWAVGGWSGGDSPGGVVFFCQASGCRPLDIGSVGPSTWIGGMKFSPSGSLLVVGTGDGRVVFFDGHSGARLGPPIAAHSGGVEHFAFSADGTLMASGGRGGTVVLWDVASRQPIGTPFPRPGLDQVGELLFRPDGRELLVQYSGGLRARVVSLNVDLKGYWQARACAAAGRQVSLAEWSVYASDFPLTPICPNSIRPPNDWEPRPPALF